MDLIVAVDLNWGIGKGNDLLYRIPEDMKYFREKTVGKYVVCGKNTLLSFPGGKPLPQRHHLLLTHSQIPDDENLTVFHSLDELLYKVSTLPSQEVLVIGGASVYRQLYKKCKRAFVTKIYCEEKQADVFFPDLSRDPDFVLTYPGEVMCSKNGLKYSFSIYENQSL